MKKSKKVSKQLSKNHNKLLEEIPVLNLDEIEISGEKKKEDIGDDIISKDNPFMSDE